MDKKRVEKFKKQLLARREELLHSIAQIQEEGKVVQQQYGPDEGDRAKISLDKELLFHQTEPGERAVGIDRCGAGPDRGRDVRPVHGVRRGDRSEAVGGTPVDWLHLVPGKCGEAAVGRKRQEES